MTPVPARVVLAFRVVAGLWLLGWFWKASYYGPALLRDSFAIRLDVAGFPAALQHPAVIAAAWLAPALAVPALIWPRAWLLRTAAGLFVACALVACVHLETFTDATFVTSFWVALWLLWLVMVAPDDDAGVLQARTLAQCVLGMIFLGGAIGKLTPEYVGGDAFLHLYFLDQEQFPYPQLRDALSADQLATLARVWSRAVIVGELWLAASPLLPFRVVVIGGCAFLALMLLGSSLYLVSVLVCLIGLLAGAALLSSTHAGAGADDLPDDGLQRRPHRAAG